MLYVEKYLSSIAGIFDFGDIPYSICRNRERTCLWCSPAVAVESDYAWEAESWQASPTCIRNCGFKLCWFTCFFDLHVWNWFLPRCCFRGELKTTNIWTVGRSNWLECIIIGFILDGKRKHQIFLRGPPCTLLHHKINPKDCQVLSLGDSGFLQFFRVVSSDYGKPRSMFLRFFRWQQKRLGSRRWKWVWALRFFRQKTHGQAQWETGTYICQIGQSEP